MQKSFSWYLMKLDRLAAWALLLTMFLYFVSGYGMTKGIISGQLAVNIHNNWLPLVLLTAFCLHTCYAVSLALKRWRIWNLLSKIVLFSFYLVFFLGFVYINNFYHQNLGGSNNAGTQKSIFSSEDDSEGANVQTQNQTGTSGSNQSQTATKVFTKAELAKYNGRNGQPAYAAVGGKVYDVSVWFSGGSHYSHFAGTDLTNAFYSRHSANALSTMPVMGTYSGK